MGVKKGTMTLVDQARQKYLLDSLSRHKSDVKRTNGGFYSQCYYRHC